MCVRYDVHCCCYLCVVSSSDTTAPWTQINDSSSASPRVESSLVLVRQENFVPSHSGSSRMAERLQKLATGGCARGTIDALAAAKKARKAKPGDLPSAGPSGVHGAHTQQYSDFGGRTLTVQAQKTRCSLLLMTKNTAHGVLFLLGFSVYFFFARKEQMYVLPSVHFFGFCPTLNVMYMRTNIRASTKHMIQI